MATHHEEKILGDKAKLVKIKVYFPSKQLLTWRESIAETHGEPTRAFQRLTDFVKALEKELGVKAVATGWNLPQEEIREIREIRETPEVSLVTKTMNNRYKLAGDFCVRLYYAEPGDTTMIHFPADPLVVLQQDPKVFIATYTKIFSAYSVAKDYVNRLRKRTTVLRDEF